MSLLAAACQIILALGIFNVWVLRKDKATPFRPEGASSIAEEFRRYGFPDWVRIGVGSTKLALAAILLVGLVYSEVAAPAASLLALLMIGAIVAHLRVGDPLMKAAPASLMLLMSTVVVAAAVV